MKKILALGILSYYLQGFRKKTFLNELYHLSLVFLS